MTIFKEAQSQKVKGKARWSDIFECIVSVSEQYAPIAQLKGKLDSGVYITMFDQEVSPSTSIVCRSIVNEVNNTDINRIVKGKSKVEVATTK